MGFYQSLVISIYSKNAFFSIYECLLVCVGICVEPRLGAHKELKATRKCGFFCLQSFRL